MVTTDQKNELGPRYDCGIDSPTFGWMPFFIRPGTYLRQQQLLKRQDVVAALQTAIADRDIDFWTRVSQFDWSKGQNQDLFNDGSRYRDSRGIDIHKLGSLSLVPMPAVIQSAAAGIAGRGGCLSTTLQPSLPNASAVLAFPWDDGHYIISVDGGATWNVYNTPAAGRISDIVTNGVAVFFSFYNVGGVWSTSASAPGNLAQYDTSSFKWGKLVWDPLRKNLYAITVPFSGVILAKINSGGAFTLIFDFLNGRLDGLDLYQGNVVLSWNIESFSRGAGQSRIYSYDGTSVTRLADMPDGSFVTGFRAVLGYLFICAFESDPFAPGQDRAGLYYMLGSAGPTRVDAIDAFYLDEVGGGCFIGTPHFMFGLGTSLYVCSRQRLIRYDIVNGGVSRSLGDDTISNLTGYVQGAASVKGVVYAVVGNLGSGPGGIVRLNPIGAGGLISTAGNSGQQLTSSRMDLGLPYVDKYWYAWEAVFDALIAGQQIAMEYSLDDGATWVACGGSPLATIGAKRFNFLIQQVNPHALYRATLIVGAAVASPVIHDVAGRFAPANPKLRVWTFTATAYDSIRGRGNKVEDSYGKDLMDFLASVAQQSETVTFYEPNDATRTPHTVWVLSAETDEYNTSGTYSPTRHEGDVPLTLWEVG